MTNNNSLNEQTYNKDRINKKILNIQTHNNIHTGKRIFSCTGCPKKKCSLKAIFEFQTLGGVFLGVNINSKNFGEKNT